MQWQSHTNAMGLQIEYNFKEITMWHQCEAMLMKSKYNENAMRSKCKCNAITTRIRQCEYNVNVMRMPCQYWSEMSMHWQSNALQMPCKYYASDCNATDWEVFFLTRKDCQPQTCAHAASVHRFVMFVEMCHAHTINAFHWLDIPFCFRTASAGWKWTRLFNGTDGQTGKHIEK